MRVYYFYEFYSYKFIFMMYAVDFLSLVNFCEYKIAALFYSSQELTLARIF